MSITRYDVDGWRIAPKGVVVKYADHAAEMQEAYKLIKRLSAFPYIYDANKWIDDHKEYAPKEAQRG